MIFGTLVACKRIDSFLAEPEPSNAFTRVSSLDQIPGAISIRNGNFSWKNHSSEMMDGNKTTKELVLRDISIDLMPGKLIGVIGQVASGKSSLVHALLGEIHFSGESSVNISGRIAYVSQSPWVRNTSVKENVLFGLPFNETQYKKALELSYFQEVLDEMPCGDETIVEEQSGNLSGGQKTRLAICRAIYSNPDIYIFDDILSSLNVELATEIVEKTLKNGLKEKTRVLVTHATQFLSSCDQIIIMKDETIKASGSLSDLKENEYLISCIGAKTSKRQDKEEKESSSFRAKNLISDETEANQKIMRDQRNSKLLDRGITYKLFEFSGGFPYLMKSTLLCVLCAAVSFKNNELLGQWSTGASSEFWIFLWLYITLNLLQNLLQVARSFFFAKNNMELVQRVHFLMVHHLLHAKMFGFWDRVPIGKVLPKLSLDLSSLEGVYKYSCWVFDLLSENLAVLAICFGVLSPSALLSCLVYIGFVFHSEKTNIGVIRDTERLKLSSVDKINSHFLESMKGVGVIRAFQREEFVKKEFTEHLNGFLRCERAFTAVHFFVWAGTVLKSLLLQGPALAALFFNIQSKETGMGTVALTIILGFVRNSLYCH